MGVTRRLESMTRAVLPPPLARLAKRVAVFPRYWAQRSRARRGFDEYGERYPQPTLMIAGLPKSGTTWLEKMVASFPGYEEVLIPDLAAYEMAHGGSHDCDLPPDIFDRFERMLVLTKMHVHGSPHNVALLREAGVPYVVLHRDLRDVAVSYVFYVRRTPWHPEFPVYRRLGLSGSLALFARRTLPGYIQWVRSWRDNRDPEQSLEFSYEQLLVDTAPLVKRVATLFGLDDSDATIDAIVAKHSFARLSGGRKRGDDKGGAAGSFFRKGIAGDWRNQFNDDLVSEYRQMLGDFADEMGYEW